MGIPQDILTLVEGAQDATVVLDQELGVLAFNQPYADLVGLRRRELTRGGQKGLCHKVFGLTSCQDPTGCLALRVFEKGRTFRESDIVATAKNMRFVVSAFPLKGADGSVYAVFEQYRDVTAEHRVQEEYRRMYEAEQARNRKLGAELDEAARAARTDGLTGLANRRCYDTQVTLMIETAALLNTPLSVVIFDLDFFKRVNDVHGHQEGDKLLQKFAAVLKTSARDGDLVARLGGEEFVLVLPGASASEAMMVATRVQERMAAQNFLTTCSGGVACYPKDGPLADDLYRVADRALYAAKHGGRNRIYLPDPGHNLSANPPAEDISSTLAVVTS